MRCLLNKENGRNSKNVPNPRSGLLMPKTETQPGTWRAHLIPSQLIHWSWSSTKQVVTPQEGAKVGKHPSVSGKGLKAMQAKSAVRRQIKTFLICRHHTKRKNSPHRTVEENRNSRTRSIQLYEQICDKVTQEPFSFYLLKQKIVF